MKLILIIADSLRRDHLGAYGNTWIHTPNLDRLASQATLFENAYIGSFPTVPTRRDIFLGLGDKGVPFNRWKGLDRDEVTMPERLGERGIPSMMITDVQNTVTAGINIDKGFTAWHCHRGQEGDPCWSDDTVPLEFPVPHDLIRYTSERWHQILMNRAHRQTEEDWFAPGTYAAAIRWLEQNHRRDNFFLYIDTFDPHEPWDPPAWYERMYDPDFRGRRFDAPTYGLIKKLGITPRELHNIRARYAGEVTMVDAALGRLLGTVERLGIDDETLIIFTTDHGTCFDYPGDNGMICKANMLGDDGRIMAAGQPPVQPLHYYPNYRGVCHIPLMIHLPGQRAAARSKAIVQAWDMQPTILDTFGMAKPPELWGESVLPLARGEKKTHRPAAVMGTADVSAQVVTPQWLYCTWRHVSPPALYDLKADPNVTRNVHGTHPEVVKKLRAHFAQHLRRQNLEHTLEEYT